MKLARGSKEEKEERRENETENTKQAAALLINTAGAVGRRLHFSCVIFAWQTDGVSRSHGCEQLAPRIAFAIRRLETSAGVPRVCKFSGCHNRVFAGLSDICPAPRQSIRQLAARFSPTFRGPTCKRTLRNAPRIAIASARCPRDL